MPRTAVAPTVLSGNAITANLAGTTIDATLVTNGVEVVGFPLDELIVRVVHTSAAERDVIVQSGSNPPADAAGQGDQVVVFAAGNVTAQTRYFGPFPSARFKSVGNATDDTGLWIDFESGFTGTITVFHVSREV